MISNLKIYPEVLANKEKLISIRRFFHENPELAYEEYQTSAYIATFLQQLGLEVIKEVGKTGVVALLKGSFPGPTILIRADMDALPLLEATNLPFKSKKDGIHHACGHDGHMAILLIAAKIISEKFKNQLKGNIKFVFQPAEEGGFGARSMIQDEKNPVLENPKVDQCYGLHLMSLEEVEKIQLCPGYFSAFSSKFFVKIQGVGGHASAPHLTKDPIFVGVQLITNFYGISARNLNPCTSNVITIGTINAGTAANIIPNKCEFSGSFRCLDLKEKDVIIKRMHEIVEGFKIAFGVEIELEISEGYPAIYNHPKETEKLIEYCKEIVGNENVVPLNFGLYGEDFSFFIKNIPGAFLLVGAAPKNSLKENKPICHHSPEFTFNEDSLLIGVSVWIKLIEKLLL